MPKRLVIFFILILSAFLVNLQVGEFYAFADEIDKELKEIEEEKEELQEEYDELNEKLDDLKKEVSEIENEISNLSNDIGANEEQINNLTNQIIKLENEITSLSKLLLVKQHSLDEQEGRKILTIRSLYKATRTNPYYALLNANSIDTATKTIRYQVKVVDEAKGFIANLNEEITKVANQKLELETVSGNLSNQKITLANLVSNLKLAVNEKTSKKSVLSDETESIKRDLSDISSAISELSSRQQKLLGEKSGDFSASLSDGSDTDDPKASPDYDPGFRPAFAAFSYGAYTHRNGMSQWGAKGRAEDGQGYKKILEFYFPNKDIDNDYDTPDKIRVVGDGISCDGGSKYYDETVDFEEYLKRIYEMYGSWPDEALKAQVVLARTYAIRIINVHGQIKPNQSHQVYKNCNKGGAWDDAVDDTKGVVITDNGNINFLAEYSSTTGGYINNVGYDGNWPNGAYEKKAGSPWFYKGWYTQSTSIHSNKCGRDHPWLTEKEMADILNAWVVWENGGDTDKISPVTTSCWGGDPYSMDEMAKKAESLDQKYSKINGVDVTYNGDGKTSKVKFDTDKGSVTIDGQVFKTVFNLRAPGYIAIKTPLFNIEEK